MTETVARWAAIIFALAVLIGEFHAEVHERPTIIGCFIRGLDDLPRGMCE